MGNVDDIIKLAMTTLKERYGDDFQLEEGDDFVFSLRNGVQVKITGNKVIPLDAEFVGLFAD